MNATKKETSSSPKTEQPTLFMGFFEKVFKTNNPNLIVNLNNPEGLKIYFSKILQLQQQGDEFPVDLEQVFPLIYSRKEEAIRALKCNNTFLKGIDYQVLRKNAENSKGGRPEEIYNISVSCFEYFIARKKRQVFEVYRQVFHETIQVLQKNQQLLPATKRNHNRITPVRMVGILSDIAKIEDTQLRLSLIEKLGV